MQRIHADEITVGMLVHDEYGPETFVVTHCTPSQHSTTVTGTLIGHTDRTVNGVSMTVTNRVFLNADQGLWNLSI